MTPSKPWTPEDDMLLGTLPDIEVAGKLGRTVAAIIKRRSRLGKLVRRPNTVAVFWSRIQKTAGCWIWTAGRDPAGYGNFEMRNVSYKAHRLSWELAHGPIPSGLYVCHRCDNPPCVRPSHLFLGTSGDNQRDACKKLRKGIGGIHHQAKLTGSQVREIRKLAGTVLNRELAERFRVSTACVEHVIHRRTWAHI